MAASQHMRLPMPMPMPAPAPAPAASSSSASTPPSPASNHRYHDARDEDEEDDEDDDMQDDNDDDDDEDTEALEALLSGRPKMVSKGTQIGGVDQATQTDLPCLRCLHGPPQHHLPPGQVYHPQYYPNYYQQPYPYPPPPPPVLVQHPPPNPRQPPYPAAPPPVLQPASQPHLQPQPHPQVQPQPHPQVQPPPATNQGHVRPDWRHYQPPAPVQPAVQPAVQPPGPPQPSTHHHHHHLPGPPAPPPPSAHQQPLPSIHDRPPRPPQDPSTLPVAIVQPARRGRPPKAAEYVPPRAVRAPSPLPGPPSWDKMVLRRAWPNLEDAENDIKNFAEFLGFALIRRRSGNRDPDTGRPTRIHYCCHLDAARKPPIDPADRKRKRESAFSVAKRQDACPWQICLKWNKRRGNQPHLFQQWHLVWTGSEDNPVSCQHNHEMDPDPANIPANRRRHMTQEIRDEVAALLEAGGMSSSGICEVMQKRHPRIAFNKSMIDNMRRTEILRRQEAGKVAAATREGQQQQQQQAAAAGGDAEGDDDDGVEDEDDGGGGAGEQLQAEASRTR